tara:strand:- start:77 stop:574 length:498 start_codon:yes stop_codon:yes gene_type:complete
MLKLIFATKKVLFAILIATVLSSCNSKKENFDIDLSNFKISNQSENKISNPNISESSKIKNKLKSYQNESEVLNSLIIGKMDPFSKEGIKVNNLTSDFQLKGFLSTKLNKYVLVSYLGKEGTITSESIGGVNTFLLPNGAKVININPKTLKLIINFENKDYSFEL